MDGSAQGSYMNVAGGAVRNARLEEDRIGDPDVEVVPSPGDHAAGPICRVMYSFSIARLCENCSTLAFGLLVICLGSVTA